MSDEKQTTPDSDELVGEIVDQEVVDQEAAGQQDAEADSAPVIDDAQAQIEALTQQLQDANDQALRAHAEAQNASRRAAQDVEKAHKFGQEKLVNDLLPVIDNLERSLDAMNIEDESLKPVVEGIELTLKSFQDTLVKHNIVALNPLGEPFDPQLHQAMTMVESPDAEPNSVINVFQKGYTLHGRLVRPAMVVVAK